MEVTEQQIKDARDKAYKNAGHNAYFGEGFNAGVKWILANPIEPLVMQKTDELIAKLQALGFQIIIGNWYVGDYHDVVINEYEVEAVGWFRKRNLLKLVEINMLHLRLPTEINKLEDYLQKLYDEV